METEEDFILNPKLLPQSYDPESNGIKKLAFKVNFPTEEIEDTEIIYNIPMDAINTQAESININVCKIIEHMVYVLDKSSKCPYKTKKLKKMSYYKLKKLHYKFIFNKGED